MAYHGPPIATCCGAIRVSSNDMNDSALQAAISGFTLGLSLIFAIGAQNTFVLRQGIMRQHVLLVVSICAASDALLISAGVFGFGSVLSLSDDVAQWGRWAGAGFLCLYGILSLRSALTSRHAMSGEGMALVRWQPAALACLAFTWLNPSVYLDTVVLLGSVSTQYSAKGAFALGAVSASFVFFFSLGFGARLLAPLFSRARAWQWFEAAVGVMMFAIAWALIRH
ncbi:L-lysine exporter family protein LysE/ArgO [Ferrimonas sediminum]|uniref:L-lysine exporter family protein LysE/ArgO n=2 Tax=Ferrimonas sediminum TaxID=718193 RepID=A0A1G8TQ96_9GAMM|nr:L-lysine exporter family protein LysE/ArgO [Ferrimonas sediminum]